MKKIILYELMRKIKHEPQLMRKFKIFAFVGFVGVLITGGLIIWAGVSAVGYVASKANQAIQSPLPRFQALNCWGRAQSLLAVQPWIERPVFDNLVSLKFACLEQKPAICEGQNCNEFKNFKNTEEGRTI